MLGFRWIASHTGAPGDSGYADEPNRLNDRDNVEITSIGKGAHAPNEPPQDMRDAVTEWVGPRGNGRCVVMVHGYSYDPSDAADEEDNPYQRVFGRPGETLGEGESWLPIVGETDDDGSDREDIAVGFGWTSQADRTEYVRAGWSNSYQYAALDLTVEASLTLALLIRTLSDAGLTVDVLAHSMGTRTTMQALRRLGDMGAGSAVRRAVLMAGSEFSLDARNAMMAVTTDVYNLVIEDDFVLNWGAEEMCHPFRWVNASESRVIGAGGMAPSTDWLDLQLDRMLFERRSEFDAWFQNLGYELSPNPTRGRGQHWAHYLHDGNRALMRDILANDQMTLRWLRDNGVIEGVTHPRYAILDRAVPQTPQTSAERQRIIHQGPF
jgi:pimeloyl-ACP methyl ester carboxylesterase